MSADDTSRPTGPVVRPTGLCVVRSEPSNRHRLYSITTSLDVLQVSGQRRQRARDIDEVLRIVARFLHDSAQ
jgi:hypothetical protein